MLPADSGPTCSMPLASTDAIEPPPAPMVSIWIIGERINPTGRKAMAAELREGNLATVKHDALAQQEAGAAILDVNAGVPGIDQPALMTRLVEELSQLVTLPLSIDTTDPETLEAGLRIYPGRALVNSVSAEPERLEKFLPIAKKYGAANTPAMHRLAITTTSATRPLR